MGECFPINSESLSSAKTEGVYVFQDETEICLFLFKKLSPLQMDIALPNEKGKECAANYFIGIFRKGFDYLGKTEYDGITRIMCDKEMYNLEDPYTNICDSFVNFSEDEYLKYKSFAKKHMETFYKIEEYVE